MDVARTGPAARNGKDDLGREEYLIPLNQEPREEWIAEFDVVAVTNVGTMHTPHIRDDQVEIHPIAAIPDCEDLIDRLIADTNRNFKAKHGAAAPMEN